MGCMLSRLRNVEYSVLLLCGVAACSAKEPVQGPNVVLITLDSVRADVLGAYGDDPRFTERSSSPRLDRLAAEGLLVEQAYSSSSWTLPSHVSIFTGQPDLVHAVEQDGHEIHPSLPLLSETLQRAGYRTAGFYSGPYLDKAFGFARGFDTYEACYGDDLRWAMEDLRRAQAQLEPTQGSKGQRLDALTSYAAAQQRVELASHRDRSSKHVADALIDQLDKHAKSARPFFLFGHFFDPHYDYAPPEEFRKAFDPDYAGEGIERDFIRNPAIATFHEGGRTRVIDERGLQHLWAMYEAEVAWTDSQIGRVLDRLDELGLVENTLVIVTADHGDEFFEHGSIGHRSTLHDELVHVPLIVRWARDFAPGSRLEMPLSLIEIAPTILRAVGLHPGASLGSGLQSVIEGAEPGPVLGRVVSTEETTLELAGTSYQAAQTMVRETYRLGSVKLFREVAWIQPTESVPERLMAIANALRLDMQANEVLTWLLLDVKPEEKGPWTEFENEREGRALVHFRETYQQLLEQRVTPGRVDVTADVLSALSGLGYAEQEARIGALPGDDLALYPPRHTVPSIR